MITWLTTEDKAFPDPGLSDEDGLLAVGGDLTIPRLIKAYTGGIFPWYEEDSPILWWSPNERLVLYPSKFIISRSLKQTIKKRRFRVTFDTAFEQVIQECSRVTRPGQEGTWITEEMINAYIELHKAGFAHSVETWDHEKLAGGLYGVVIGHLFYGESMFHKVTDASKVAMFNLVENLKLFNFSLIDAQVHTEHLQSLGAEIMRREDFLEVLEENRRFFGREPSWKEFTEIDFNKLNESRQIKT